MATINHIKTNTIADWTQPELDTVIAGGAAPLPPPGTVLADVVLPSDWNANHTISDIVNADISASAAISVSKTALALTTSGSSGAATLIGDTLNIPQYSGGGGSGDVVGPSSATDNAIARYDGTTGKLIQNSAATIADTTGDITAGKYNTVAISGSSTPTLAVTGTTTVSGANSGDQTSVSGNSGSTNALISATTTVNVSSATAPTNGQVLTATSGTAATWQTPSGGSGGVANLTPYEEVPSGTVNSSNVTFTIANTPIAAQDVLLAVDGIVQTYTTDFTVSGTTITMAYAPTTGSTLYAKYYNASSSGTLTVPNGGTGVTSLTAYAPLFGGTTSTGAIQSGAIGATTEILVGGGAATLPVWTTATGSGAPVRATSPTLVTPALGTPSALVLTNATGGVVAGGGTGLSSTTAYAVLCGGTTSTGALQSIASVGTSGQVLTSNGAGALPTFQAGGGGTQNPKTLACSTTALSHTGSTSETVLATYTLPANTLPSNGVLRISMLTNRSGTAGTVTPRIRFNGIGGTVYAAKPISTTDANNNILQHIVIASDNATNTQKAWGGATSTTSEALTSTAIITSAIDTTANVDIVFTMQLANSGDSGKIAFYFIELITP